ncbi:MAG: ankyrin repeat domain-containing protein, partial [Acidiferrobacterales bacterium]
MWPIVLIAAILLTFVSSGLSAALNDDWVSALEKHDLSKIEKLIELGVDVNLATDRGKTALMLAAHEGEVRLVRDLLKAGADMNHTTQSGGTALMYSVLSGDPRPVKVLLA